MASRFLELGLRTPDILESLHFYRGLGFTELSTGEMWPHKYAALTDGTMVIGLHERELAEPVLTFVQPALRRHALNLQDAGQEFDSLHLGEDEFHHAVMRDTSGFALMLVEARTYSPAPEPPASSALGDFLELLLPSRDVMASARFWAPLAPRLAAHRESPDVRFRFAAGPLVIGMGDAPAVGRALLVYVPDDAGTLQQRLERLGVEPSAGPALGGDAYGAITTPEGLDILLLRRDYW